MAMQKESVDQSFQEDTASEFESEVPPADRIPLSPTVQEVKKELPATEPVSTVDVARAIVGRHPEYAQKQAGSLVFEEVEGDTNRRPVDEWLSNVHALYNTHAVSEIHGRLVLIGLALLSPAFREQLNRDGVWDALIGEVREPLESLLTAEARGMLVPTDHVRTIPDNPLERLDQDQLGRAAFARFLAKRIDALSEDEGSYAIHLYGPWGSGKSTLLQFVSEVLGDGSSTKEENRSAPNQKWLIVKFNAWRHQHIRPPWWALLEAVFQQTRWALNPWERIREYGWRFAAGRGQYLVSMLILIGLVWVLVLVVLPEIGVTSPSGMIDAVGKMAAAAVTIWGIASVTGQSLLPGSAEAAQSYVNVTQDPMNTIKVRFENLIARLRSSGRVAILIDDLDRCRSEYVVELLEGIQTLFRDAPVAYVVAADRRWLNACYEEVYSPLESQINARGKSLGTLFLEKTFQLSTPVPGVPPQLKKEYWYSLIGVREAEADVRRLEAKQRADVRIGSTTDEMTMRRRLGETNDPVEQQAIREEIVDRLAEPEVVERTEHALKKFAPLLEPNPRSIKRLVNGYITNRAMSTLSYLDIERDQLALWTILTLRWPRLANALGEDSVLHRLEHGEGEPVDEEIRKLLKDEEVRSVINGRANGRTVTQKSLDVETLRECAGLRG